MQAFTAHEKHSLAEFSLRKLKNRRRGENNFPRKKARDLALFRGIFICDARISFVYGKQCGALANGASDTRDMHLINNEISVFIERLTRFLPFRDGYQNIDISQIFFDARFTRMNFNFNSINVV